MTRQIQTDISNEEQRPSYYLTFLIDDVMYGVSVMQVEEIWRHVELEAIAGEEPCVLGVTRLRNYLVKVIDLRQCMGLSPARPTDNSRILFIKSRDYILGFLVDKAVDILAVPGQSVIRLNTDSDSGDNRCVLGTCYSEGLILKIVGFDRLFDEQQWSQVVGF